MRIWRISNFADLSGQGGMLIDGRWHRRGVPVVYCTDHPSTALLEIIVHATRRTVPSIYQLIEISVPDELAIVDPVISDGWERASERTQQQGMEFLMSNRHALMRVPSIIMPKAVNYILNPSHPEAARFTIVSLYRYPFDSRLLK